MRIYREETLNVWLVSFFIAFMIVGACVLATISANQRERLEKRPITFCSAVTRIPIPPEMSDADCSYPNVRNI